MHKNNKLLKTITPLALIVILLLASLTLSSSKEDYKVLISYQKPSTTQDKATLNLLKKEAINEIAIEIINEIFFIPKSINIKYGGADGPEYDSETHQVLIPYPFIQEIKQRFIKDKYTESGLSIEEATMDVVTHTILHELAHALINIYDLPIVVKEEDAADALATLLLIELFEDGQEIAITAADIFKLESNDIKDFEEADFWDEHSLDIQRYYNTLCLIYGSAPKKYSELLEDADFSDEKAEQCIDDYQQLYFSWATLLKPHLKNTQVFNY
jgi:hypothetical protein